MCHKKWFILSLLLLVSAIGPAWGQSDQPGSTILEKGDFLAIIGDSITEQHQYSKYIETYIMACYPQLEATVMQFGWGGEQASGFLQRMENDLIPFNPDVVTLCYGMNDGHYTTYTQAIGSDYREALSDIIGRLEQRDITVVVGSPGVVDSFYFRRGGLFDVDAETYNRNLEQLTAIARDVAQHHGAYFADIHHLMKRVMQKAKATYDQDYPVAGSDGVHPNANGHVVMATRFLKTLGFDGELASLTLDMSGEASASEGHQVIESAPGQAVFESRRYAYCFYGERAADPNATRSILPFISFHEELNRFMLKVENLKTETATVIWDDWSKDFSSAELQAGINLAAEFPTNPFSEPLKAVEREVREKQIFETVMIKDFIHRFPLIIGSLDEDPELQQALDVIRDRMRRRHRMHHQTVIDAVNPIRHRIRVIEQSG